MWQEREYAGEGGGRWFERAPGTAIIVAATVLVFLAKVVANAIRPGFGGQMDSMMATSIAGWHGWQLWRPFSYMLAHGGSMHMLMNMLMFWFVGTMLEGVVGRRRLVIIYVVSGVIASVSPLLYAGARHSTIGASGAINGVLVAAAVLMPDAVVMFMFVFPVKLRYLVIGLLALNVLALLGDGTGDPGVPSGADQYCHVIGAATGFVLTWVVPRAGISEWLARRRRRAALPPPPMPLRSPDDAQRLETLLEKISASGMISLTDSERAFLHKMSDQARKTGGRS